MLVSDNALRRNRHFTLIQLFNNSINLNGDACEYGTFHGLSAYQISSIIKNKKIDKTLHIFDSFEGLSQIDDIDSSNKINLDQKKLLQRVFIFILS